MDIQTASVIFLDRIEKNLSEIIKLVGGGELKAPDLAAAIMDGLKPILEPMAKVAADTSEILKVMRSNIEDSGDTQEQERLLPAIAALQNTVTVSTNRSASEMRSALSPLAESLGKLLQLLSKKRKYKMVVDRNHTTKLIQGIEIIETEGD